MKVDPKSVVFVLELLGSLLLTAGGVVAKHFLGVSSGKSMLER